MIIARELIKEPKIILFDEVNMDLDLEMDFILRQILNLQKGKITIVLVSSRPSLLLMADQHYLIKNKQIIKVQKVCIFFIFKTYFLCSIFLKALL